MKFSEQYSDLGYEIQMYVVIQQKKLKNYNEKNSKKYSK